MLANMIARDDGPVKRYTLFREANSFNRARDTGTREISARAITANRCFSRGGISPTPFPGQRNVVAS